MDLERNGVRIELDFVNFSDPELIAAASEMQATAAERGLVLTLGSEAVEAAQAEAPEQSPDDAERSIADIRADIDKQFIPAINGYRCVIESVNNHQRKQSKEKMANERVFSDLLKLKLDQWEQNGALDYVREQLEADPELKFTLVAQPNVVLSPGRIKRLAQDFGKQQPYETYVYDPLYDQYTGEELSGVTDKDSPVRFLLIPNKTDESLYGTVAQQKTALQERQADGNTFLVVPAPAVAPSLWYRLRANGDLPTSKNANDFAGAFDKTYIRHFDMEPKRLGGGLYVPFSCVYDDGEPYLYYSYAQNDYNARVAVG